MEQTGFLSDLKVLVGVYFLLLERSSRIHFVLVRAHTCFYESWIFYLEFSFSRGMTYFWSRFYIVILGMTFFFSTDLLFPIFIWTFISFFYLDFRFPFSIWTFISFLDFYFPFRTNRDLILDFFQVFFQYRIVN